MLSYSYPYYVIGILMHMDGVYTPRAEEPARPDQVEQRLVQVAHGILVAVFGLLPVFFIPSNTVPLEYTKTLLVIVGLLISTVLYSLATLRSGRLRLAFPAPVYALFTVVLVSLASALLSGDRYDALVGNTMEVGTTLFTLVLLAIVVVPLIVNFSKAMIIRVYMLLGAGALLLALYHVLRLVFGASALSMGVFPNLVSGPFGGWNSLGLFFGLTILLSMVALEQLPLTRPGKGFFALVTTLSLVMLVVINFVAIWVVLGLTSMVVLMYGLVKDRFTDQSYARDRSSSISGISLSLSAIVCVVSLAALLGGTNFGTMVSNISGVSYLEVRPSLGATLDIARHSLDEDSLLGLGPNRFADAWRMFKDPAINTSIFWSTDFESGYSYFATIPITIGILGALAWLAFLLLFIFIGLRVVLRPVTHDTLWYFIGTSSFAAGIYLWGMALVYTPSVVALLLAAFFTSCLASAYVALCPARALRFSLAENKRAAIVLVGVVMVIIVSSVAAVYGVSRHFGAVVMFNEAVSKVPTGTPLDEVEAQIEAAYILNQNDIFARQVAEYQLAKINSLLALAQPSETEQQAFETAIAQGVVAATRAIENDPTDARNHAVAGALYSVLAGIGIEDTANRAGASFAEARRFDPQNPLYPLLEAQLATRTGDVEKAKTAVRTAVTLKPNYTEALLFMADIDIATGNVSGAIDTTRAILSLEPQNPARYFQLGVLQTAAGSTTEAVRSFEAAVALDENYANARYFLARLYAAEGNRTGAREQLVVVQKLNPDNKEVAALIDSLDAGGNVGFTTATSSEVELPDSTQGEPVTSTGEPDTPLVTPVNAVTNEAEPETAQSESSSPSTETETTSAAPAS